MYDVTLCKDCNGQDICIHYHRAMTNAGRIDMSITSCVFKEKLGGGEIPQANEPLLAPRPARQYENFKAMSKQAKEEGKKRKPVVSLIKEEVTESEALTVCKSCEGTTYVSDIVPCDKCGAETCSNCRTEIAETNKKLCDKCWSEE